MACSGVWQQDNEHVKNNMFIDLQGKKQTKEREREGETDRQTHREEGERREEEELLFPTDSQ